VIIATSAIASLVFSYNRSAQPGWTAIAHILLFVAFFFSLTGIPGLPACFDGGKSVFAQKGSRGKPPMQASRFLVDRDDGAKIQVYRWAPERAPKAAVQISHGMCEHAGRY
jgi:hypothetical protein